jgi:hypothetical protein
LGEAFQISDAIAIAVFVTSDKNFHECAVLPIFLWALILRLPLDKKSPRQ